MVIKVQIFTLIVLMLIATIDFVHAYTQDGKLELFYLGSIYLACGIGFKALHKLKEKPDVDS